MLLERLEERRRKEKKRWLDSLVHYNGLIGTITTIAVALVGILNLHLATRQAEISERALTASNRNIEMAALLNSLRTTCEAAGSMGDLYFSTVGFQFNTNFNLHHPERLPPGAQRYMRFVDGPVYPDPHRVDFINKAKVMSSAAADTLNHFQIMGLYLTEAEAREAEKEDLQQPFADFVDLSNLIITEQVSARELVGDIMVMSFICATLPGKLAAWFRDSARNPLGYILNEGEVRFQWVPSKEELWLVRRSAGKSLEERTERQTPGLEWNFNTIAKDFDPRFPNSESPQVKKSANE